VTASGPARGSVAAEHALGGEAVVRAPRQSLRVPELLIELMLVLVGLLLATLAAEVLTRRFAPQLLYRYPQGLYAAHPTRAYTLVPNFHGRLATPEFDTAVVTNSLGLRDDVEYGAKAPGTIRILVLGDSFAMGVGVEARETFTKLVAERLNAGASGMRFDTINSGVPSYSTREETLYLEEQGLQLQPDIVLLALYVGNDILDNTRTSWSRVVDGDLVDPESHAGILPLAARRILSRHSQLYHFLWPYQRRLLGHGDEERRAEQRMFAIYDRPEAPSIAPAWQATEHWLERLARITRAHDVALGVIVIPERLQLEPATWAATAARLNSGAAEYRPERPDRQLVEMLQRLHVPSLDLLSPLQSAAQGQSLYFRLDGHWTPAGHRVAADAIVAFLGQARLIPFPGAPQVF